MFQVVFSSLLSVAVIGWIMDTASVVFLLACAKLVRIYCCEDSASNRLQNKSAFICRSICPSVCILLFFHLQHHNLPTREIGCDIRKQEVTSSSSNRNVLGVNKNKEVQRRALSSLPIRTNQNAVSWQLELQWGACPPTNHLSDKEKIEQMFMLFWPLGAAGFQTLGPWSGSLHCDSV